MMPIAGHWGTIFHAAYTWTSKHAGRGSPVFDEVLWLQLAFGRCVLAAATDFDEEERDASRG
jgi:hypothetical protein